MLFDYLSLLILESYFLNYFVFDFYKRRLYNTRFRFQWANKLSKSVLLIETHITESCICLLWSLLIERESRLDLRKARKIKSSNHLRIVTVYLFPKSTNLCLGSLTFLSQSNANSLSLQISKKLNPYCILEFDFDLLVLIWIKSLVCVKIMLIFAVLSEGKSF